MVYRTVFLIEPRNIDFRYSSTFYLLFSFCFVLFLASLGYHHLSGQVLITLELLRYTPVLHVVVIILAFMALQSESWRNWNCELQSGE